MLAIHSMIPVQQVIRSKRKTLEISIPLHEPMVIVRAPYHASVECIERFLGQKQAWILKKLKEIGDKPKASPKKFIDGEEFLFLGQNYSLQLTDKVSSIVLVDKLYFPKADQLMAYKKLEKWYRKEALQYIRARCQHFAGLMNCQPAYIKLSNAKYCWAACIGKQGKLRFNWRLIMAPPEVIDYVVVHELCHIEFPNHPPAFWAKVERFLSDYETSIDWLEENGGLLNLVPDTSVAV